MEPSPSPWWKRRPVRLAGGAALALAVLAAAGLLAGWLASPRTYSGKTLREHLESMPYRKVLDITNSRIQAHSPALWILDLPREESVPELAELLGEPGPRPAWLQAFDEFCESLTGTSPTLLTYRQPDVEADLLPAKAAAILLAMGSDAAPARPALKRAMESRLPDNAYFAMRALEASGLSDEELQELLLPLIRRPPDPAYPVSQAEQALRVLARRPAALQQSYPSWKFIAASPGHPARTEALVLLEQARVPEDEQLKLHTQALKDGDSREFGVSTRWFLRQKVTAPPAAIAAWKQAIDTPDSVNQLQIVADALLTLTPNQQEAAAALNVLAHVPDLTGFDAWSQLNRLRMMWRARQRLHDLDPQRYPLEAARAEELASSDPMRRFAAAENVVTCDRANAKAVVGELAEQAGSLGLGGVGPQALQLLQQMGPDAREALPRLRQWREDKLTDSAELRETIAVIEGDGAAGASGGD